MPVVLVGCQGDNKVYGTNTLLHTHAVLDNVNVVMHVETSATNSKSVNVAFQVRLRLKSRCMCADRLCLGSCSCVFGPKAKREHSDLRPAQQTEGELCEE